MENSPSSSKLIRWFDPRFRQIGTWAFILNRVTAIGLTVYLILHLYMLGKLAQGPEAYDSFIALAKTPLIKFGELLVVAAGILHGTNGIRITLTSFGILVRYQVHIFIITLILSIAAIVYFAYFMFFLV
jgi:succinate dehydrogenase / fumarate reductase, cytochrome b subunit